MAERQKLKVIEVQPRQEVGKNKIPIILFKALNSKDQEFNYQTFKTQLFEIIEKKGVIDCEVEVKVREIEGNTYTDRNITQIYVDGKPVIGQRGYQKTDSPETRASIEAQTAFNGAMQLAASPAMITQKYQEFIDRAIDWGLSKLQSPTVKVPFKTPQDVVTSKSEVKKVETATEFMIPKNIGELCSWALKHGKSYGPAWVAKQANVSKIQEITDVNKVYQEIKSITGWED